MIMTPSHKKEYPYCCPFCYRYFNVILESKCCGEYTCHFCIQDIKDAEAHNPNLNVSCPFQCLNFVDGQVFEVNDVNPFSQVKKYTDSQVARSEVAAIPEIKVEAEEEEDYDKEIPDNERGDVSARSF